MTVDEALNQAYTGRANLVKASKACGVDLSTFKKLLQEKVKRTAVSVEQQLILPL